MITCVRTPPCAIACINLRAHVKYPVIHVRVWWIMETLKHSACTVGLVARFCRSLLSPGKAPRISHGRNPIRTILSHLHLNREGRWGTADDFATRFLYFSLFSTALWDLANSRPVHSLMLSSHLFLCLLCLLPPFTVPCKMVLARPDERET